MKTSEIRILLQKYYDGLTSPQEESGLELYFLQEQVDPEFEADQLHFQALSSMRNEEIPVPDDLESIVLTSLKKVQNNRISGSRRIMYISFSAAAGVLLMVSTFLFLSRQNSEIQPVSDPKIAYAESREALEMVSKFFNEGTAQLSELAKIQQAVKPLNKLNSLDKAAQSLSKLGKLQNQK